MPQDSWKHNYNECAEHDLTLISDGNNIAE